VVVFCVVAVGDEWVAGDPDGPEAGLREQTPIWSCFAWSPLATSGWH